MTSQTKPAHARGRWACPPRSIRPASPRPQRRDCQGQLLAALNALTAPTGTILEASLRPWCSATFIGAQHRIALRIDGADAAQQAAALAAKLSETDFALRGHIVAAGAGRGNGDQPRRADDRGLVGQPFCVSRRSVARALLSACSISVSTRGAGWRSSAPAVMRRACRAARMASSDWESGRRSSCEGRAAGETASESL